MTRLLDRVFNGPWPLTLLMMGVFGGLFALSSANIAMLLNANIDYILESGAAGMMEGGTAQFLELAATGYVSLVFYVLFKGCLYGLLGRFQKH